MKKPAEPIPTGLHTVTPALTMRDADKAIEFSKRAFGAVSAGAKADMPVTDMFWGDRCG